MATCCSAPESGKDAALFISSPSAPMGMAPGARGGSGAFHDKDKVVTMLEAILKNQEIQSKPKPVDTQLARITEMMEAVLGGQQRAMEQQRTLLMRFDEHMANPGGARSPHVMPADPEQSMQKMAPENDLKNTAKADQAGNSHELSNLAKSPAGQPKLKPSALQAIVLSTKFEVAMSLVIVANTIIMFMSLQLKNLNAGWRMGVAMSDGNWDYHSGNFEVIEHMLNFIYVVELSMKLGAFGFKLFHDAANAMDAFIVVSAVVDTYIFQPLNIQGVDLSILRLVRLTRLFKLLKVVRSAPIFSQLRVLLRTLGIAVAGVIWSVFLLSFVIIAAGILTAQLAGNYLDSEAIPLDRRIWLYKHFGTTTSAMHTMFECTFTGSWHRYSRPLIEEVSYGYALFWILWVIMINFTTMRVIGALFLKDTMAVSARDAENCAMNQLKHKGESAEKLRIVFLEADINGSGAVDLEEFEIMMDQPHVVKMFGSLGLDVDEVAAFFTVLSADDGSADYNEFITGALYLATSAPTLDRLKAMQGNIRNSNSLDSILHCLDRLCVHLKVDQTSLAHLG
jgi:hypothetical protein